jgi:hypothetical protein
MSRELLSTSILGPLRERRKQTFPTDAVSTQSRSSSARDRFRFDATGLASSSAAGSPVRTQLPALIPD